ncbi:MAG: EAL domain-containing protein [Gammaproteobacteria bacterium]
MNAFFRNRSPEGVRFLSLKWKALLLTSLVLVAVTVSYTGLNYFVLDQQFQKRRLSIQQEYARQVQGLLDQSSQRLRQLGAILASLPDIQRQLAGPPSGDMTAAFDHLWTNLAIDRGMEVLVLFSDPGHAAIARGWRAGDARAKRLTQTVKRVIENETPEELYDCANECIQFAVIPVLSPGDRSGAMVLGVSLADVVLDFQRVSGADMGLIASAPIPDPGSADTTRYLKNWRQRVVAVSNSARNIPLLSAVAARFPFSQPIEAAIYESVEGHAFEVRLVPLAGSPKMGQAHLVVIAEVTGQVQEIQGTTHRNIALGIGGLIVAESLLLAVLWGPMSRLKRAASNLPLLAESAFTQVRAAISGMHAGRWLRDEVDVLNTTAVTLSSQLETLHGELDKKSQDLAERVNELGQERDFVTQVLDTAQVIILTQNRHHEILMTNPYAETLAGYSRAELLGRSFLSLMARDQPTVGQFSYLADLVSGASVHAQEECDLRCKDDSTLQVVWHHSRLKGLSRDDPMILSVGMDITARKRAEMRLAWLADHDPLTGLFNRRRLQEELEEAIARAKRYEHSGALIFFDLDQFKYVNDTSGHPAGDRLLEALGGSLPQVLREIDVIGRLGGDEFAIVLGRADAQEASQVAKKILEHITDSEFRFGSKIHKVSASIGIALFPAHGSNVKDLLTHADLAMYQAKETGRGRWHVFSFEDQGQRLMQERVLWKERVENALAEKRFVLFVQPIVEIRSGITCHYEVLVRMRADDGSLISPANFIEVAERAGLIHAIDRMVLSEAMRSLAKLKRHGRQISFSINLSAHAFNDPELLPFVQRLLYETNLDPKQVILEMTETAAVADLGSARRLIEAIRDLGCAFALDDFGRGFSSFYYLKELPMEYVKIDGSFIRGLADRPDDQALVRAMGQIAKAFGKKTVAEHVETGAVLNLLAQFEIDYAQGYFTGKPVEMSAAFADDVAA